MITSAHSIDGKVIQIAELNKKNRELRAEFYDTGTLLMQMKMESNIRQKVVSKGIFPSKTSPHKIKITPKKN